MAMFREIADIQTSETLNLPTPDVEKNNIAVESTQIQQDMVKELGERAGKYQSRFNISMG